MIFFNKAVQR